MKKGLFSIILLVPIILSACGNDGDSYEHIPSWVNSIDFNPVYGNHYKLAEYSSNRSYSSNENGIFDGRILNPVNYKEDEDTQTWYQIDIDDTDDQNDYSDENIVFNGYNTQIEQYLSDIEEGFLETEQIINLIDILDSNDDIINCSHNIYEETILYNNFFYGDYYEFNNYHRTENIEKKRYENNIVNSNIEGTILKPDGYTIDFTAIEQIWTDENNIYELYEETFPVGFALANNYKITTERGSENLKKALSISGGGIAKRWFEKYLVQYQEYTDETHEKYRLEYNYQIIATKQEQTTQISFSGFNTQYQENENTIYEMELYYRVFIVGGTVFAIEANQIYWAQII
jgi:hypothetical protein